MGLGILLTGAAIATTALVVPLFACQTQTTVDAYGTVHSSNACDRVSDGVKVGWIAGGGVGLVLALIGGILMMSSQSSPPTAPGVTEWTRPASPTLPRIGIGGWLHPWLDIGARVDGRSPGSVAGLRVIAAF